jgi:hypothetical protein
MGYEPKNFPNGVVLGYRARGFGRLERPMPTVFSLPFELERLADRAPVGQAAAVRNEALRLIWRRLRRANEGSAPAPRLAPRRLRLLIDAPPQATRTRCR